MTKVTGNDKKESVIASTDSTGRGNLSNGDLY
jgi:hypothetical protein